MLSDAEIKKNIEKCSRCALCVENCPIYDITKNENNTSRGLICKLLGYLKGSLKDKEIKNDLKICLNCTKCQSNCPSGVNTAKIFAYKNACLNPSKISQKMLLGAKLLPIKILYFLNFFKRMPKKTEKKEILYFKGCIATSQHKKTFLDNLFYNPNFACCGLPYLSSGDIKNYEKAVKKNIELIKNASCVIFDCASCKSAVSEYIEQKDKLVFFTDFLIDKKYKLKENSKYKNKTITFHKPCHLNQQDYIKIEQFLSSIQELNYKSINDPDLCCGFGGSYFIFHPIIASKIVLKKAFSIKNTKADLILSVCPSCTMGLRFGQLISFNFKKTLELRDFIDKELVLY